MLVIRAQANRKGTTPCTHMTEIASPVLRRVRTHPELDQHLHVLLLNDDLCTGLIDLLRLPVHEQAKRGRAVMREE